MKSYNELSDFVTAAVKSRKYNENTAGGIKAALKLFEDELNEEEKSSLEVFKNRVDQIYKSVFSKNLSKFSAKTLQEYLRRVKKVISDYDTYGSDPSKFAGWEVRSVAPRAKKVNSKKTKETETMVGDEGGMGSGTGSVGSGTGMNRMELSIRPDAKATIIVPHNLTTGEAKRLKSIIDSLVIED